MNGRQCRDLIVLAEGLQHETWKTAPKFEHLVGFADLCILILELGSVKLSHQKLVAACMSQPESEAGPCLFGQAGPSADFIAYRVSFKLRCLLSKLRSYCNDPAIKRAIDDKAKTPHQKTTLMRLESMWPTLPSASSSSTSGAAPQRCQSPTFRRD